MTESSIDNIIHMTNSKSLPTGLTSETELSIDLKTGLQADKITLWACNKDNTLVDKTLILA